MAMKKFIPSAKPAKKPEIVAAAKPVTSAVRNTPIPKSVSTGKKIITQGDIAKRAYEIWLSGTGGSETDNWLRAERELRASSM